MSQYGNSSWQSARGPGVYSHSYPNTIDLTEYTTKNIILVRHGERDRSHSP